MYIIKRMPDGAYVARPGSPSSYTKQLQTARTFPTREAAERDRCPGNEIVTTPDAEMRP
jgi:hypothetical protein